MVTTQNSGGGNYRHHRGESPSPTSRRPSCHSWWWWCGSSHPCWTGCHQVVLLLLSFMVQPCVLAFLCADLLLVLHNQGQSQFPILSFKVKAFPSFLYLSTGKRLSTGKLGPGQFGPWGPICLEPGKLVLSWKSSFAEKSESLFSVSLSLNPLGSICHFQLASCSRFIG